MYSSFRSQRKIFVLNALSAAVRGYLTSPITEWNILESNIRNMYGVPASQKASYWDPPFKTQSFLKLHPLKRVLSWHKWAFKHLTWSTSVVRNGIKSMIYILCTFCLSFDQMLIVGYLQLHWFYAINTTWF